MKLTDTVSDKTITQSIAPAALTSTSTGTGVDLANYGSVWVVFPAGTKTDGTHTPKLQDSADDSTYADVASTDQVGTLVAITSNSQQKVGYVGSKRYLRAVVTVSGATTGAIYGAYVIASQPHKAT